MKKMIVAILMLFLGMSTYSVDFLSNNKIIKKEMKLNINGELRTINIHRLIEMTQMMESSGGRNKYSGRIAKSSYQYELATWDHYKKLPMVKDLYNNLSEMIGHKLDPLKEEDSKYITYILYYAKLYYHKNRIVKSKFFNNEDLEWTIYKEFWNSSKGASTYAKWNQRIREYRVEELIKGEIGLNSYNLIARI